MRLVKILMRGILTWSFALHIYCRLYVTVKEVRVEPFLTGSQEEVGTYREQPVEVPSIASHRKIQVISKALDLGTPEHNDMIKDIGHVSIDFSPIPMYLLHNI